MAKGWQQVRGNSERVRLALNLSFADARKILSILQCQIDAYDKTARARKNKSKREARAKKQKQSR